MLVSKVADEETTVEPDEADASPSIHVDHERNSVSVVAVVYDAVAVSYEDEWSPLTADEFVEKRIDDDDRTSTRSRLSMTTSLHRPDQLRGGAGGRIYSHLFDDHHGKYHTDTVEGLPSGSVQLMQFTTR